MSDNIDDGPKHSTEVDTETVTTGTGLVLPAGVYNNIKWFVLIALPALITAYSGLSLLFNLPAVAQVVGSGGILGILLGSLLGISNANFQKNGADGSINANVVGDTVQLSKLSLPNIAPEELAAKKSITIQVNPTGSSQ